MAPKTRGPWWKVVPVEPTADMRAVLRNDRCVYQDERDLYAALLAASPPSPVEDRPIIGWATHHDEPMLFPTREEAALHCDADEEPIALVAKVRAQEEET